MTTAIPSTDEPGDAELISAVRGGDNQAYGALFERHVESARRLARQLLPGSDADDLVSEAFAKVLSALQRGGGPDLAFRAYLLTSLRRVHVDRIRANARLTTTDDLERYDPGVPFRDTAVEAFDSAAAAKAYATLPERWQTVLWHLEVEGEKPAEVARMLGMSPNSVSALAYRAREGLRQAFLAMHAQDVEDEACAWTQENLGAYIRQATSRRDNHKVKDHLDGCRRCTAIYLELTEVNSNLAGILGPLVLGSAATGFLASSVVPSKGLLFVLFDRAKDVAAAHVGASAAGGVAVATAAVIGVVALQNPAASDREAAPVTDRSTTSVLTAPVTPRPTRQPAKSPSPTRRIAEAPVAPVAPVTTSTVPTSTPAPEAPIATPTPNPTPPPSKPTTPAPETTPPASFEPEPPPSTPPPPPVTQDLAVTARATSLLLPTSLLWNVDVTVTGLTEGTGTLSVTSDGSTLAIGRCFLSKCSITRDPQVFQFAFTGTLLDPINLTFRVTSDQGVTDPDSGNNSTVVHLTR